MFDILQTSSIAGFVAGVFFVLGMGLCLFLLTRFIPEKYFNPKGSHQFDPELNKKSAYRRLSLEYFERKQQKVFVRVNNPTQEMFENLMFRLTARNLKGELVEETLAMASSSFGPDSTTECLLKIHDDVERQSILDPANEVTVELTTSYHFH